MRKFLSIFLIFLSFSLGSAQAALKPLPVDDAFQLKVFLEKKGQLLINWQIEPNYYLYKDQIKIKPDTDSIKIGSIQYPIGQQKKDELHGEFQAYYKSLSLLVPLAKTDGLINLKIQYQGCSSKGFCYPPVKKTLKFNLANSGFHNLTPYLTSENKFKKTSSVTTDKNYAESLFQSHHLLIMMLSFLGLGLLLAFTPCVLPMIPILSSIIVGYGNKISTAKAFSLSLAYVLGMALTYALAGIAVALIGSNIQIAMQNPIVITLFSLLFVALALSLFGFYDLKLPNHWQQKLSNLNHKTTGGTYVGVFIMGVLSTLIVSPCVSAPLVGTLAYIAETGDVVLGGTALLCLGLGMGIPLLLIGTSAGKILPRAGNWMNIIKKLFAIMMLAMAIYMITRIMPGSITLLLWSGLLALSAILIWQVTHERRVLHGLNRAFGLALMMYSLMLIAGSYLGNTDPLNPLARHATTSLASAGSQFAIIRTLPDLQRELALAKQNKMPVLIDFYADWCASCLMMDRNVFSSEEIRNSLEKYKLLRIDVTQNNADDKSLLKYFNVIAPPTIIFFNANGEQLHRRQIVGEVNAKELLADLGEIDDLNTPRICDNKTRAC